MHWTIDELENPTLEATLWGEAANPDGDLHHNLFEYTAGTTPTDMNSVFSLAVEPVPGQPDQRNVIFSPRLSDRTYTVLTRPDLSGSPESTASTSSVSDNGMTRTVTTSHPGEDMQFYRVRISLP